jgi:hypothetical protein
MQDGDITVLKLMANALMKFQILFGVFPRVLGVGDNAAVVLVFNVS